MPSVPLPVLRFARERLSNPGNKNKLRAAYADVALCWNYDMRCYGNPRP